MNIMDLQLYKCGYCSFLINSQCENLLEHTCLKEIYVEGQHDLVENDQKVLTIVQKHDNHITVGVTREDGMEEKLIKFVQDRPPLYNAKLPLQERTHSKKTMLWMEIFNLFGGSISMEDLQKKWKYLRDRYNRAKKRVKEYKPSGSEGVGEVDPGFSFYSLMLFLDDGMSNQPTTSSVAIPARETSRYELSPSQELSEDRPISSASVSDARSDVMSPTFSDGMPNISTPRSTPAKAKTIKKRKREDENTIEKEVEEILLGAKKQPDGVDFFVNRVGESLRKIPYAERTKLELQIMQLVYETERRLNIE